MLLEIISPDKLFYKGETSKVTVPGVSGSFTVLNGHAPIISIMEKGKIVYDVNGKDNELNIISGLVEVKNNVISICIDKLDEDFATNSTE